LGHNLSRRRRLKAESRLATTASIGMRCAAGRWEAGAKACHTCKKWRVSCQVDGKPVIGGEPRTKKNDGSPMHKKRRVPKETIVESKAEVEVVEVMAEPEARPHGRAWTGPAEVFPRASEGLR